MPYTPIEILPIDIPELTEVDIPIESATGVLDVLLRTMNNHLKEQYDAGRINGPEYATVYMELYGANLTNSVNYVVQRNRLKYELANLALEGELTEARIKEITENLKKVPLEMEMLTAQIAQTKLITTERIPAEILGVKASTALTDAQRDRVIEEMTLIPHQIEMLGKQMIQVDAETSLTLKNVDRVQQELAKIPIEIEILRNQVTNTATANTLLEKQVEAATLELGKIPKEIALVEAQTDSQKAGKAQTEATTLRIQKETDERLPIEIANLTKQGLQFTAETALTTVRTTEVTNNLAKIPVEIDYLIAQMTNMAKQTILAEKNIELKDGELDLQVQQIDLAKAELLVKREELEVARANVETQRSTAELYKQKVVTEQAQTKANVAEAGSVIGMNNKVLQGQIDGYKRDAEQKAAKIYLDGWMIGAQNQIREANSINKLSDDTMGKVMAELLVGVGVTP